METLKFNLTKTYGQFKLLNATNGGPLHKRCAVDQYTSNFKAYLSLLAPNESF